MKNIQIKNKFRIKCDDYSKKEYYAISNNLDRQEWQCPRCDEVINAWWSERVWSFSGYSTERVAEEFRANLNCDECGYRRKDFKAHMLKKGQKPRPRRHKGTVTMEVYLKKFHNPRATKNGPHKFWSAEVRGRSVKFNWGPSSPSGYHMSGAGVIKFVMFDSGKEAREFVEKKVAEKLAKGYINPSAKKKIAARRKTA